MSLRSEVMLTIAVSCSFIKLVKSKLERVRSQTQLCQLGCFNPYRTNVENRVSS